jgi:transposase
VDEFLWAEARRLRHVEGFSVRAISRQLRTDRRTIRKALKANRYPQREMAPRGSLLDAFQDTITTLLERYPKLSGVRVLEKLRPLGYTGGITILRDRLAQIRPRRSPEAFLKRETLPGEEAQVDWGSCGHISVDGTVRPLSVFVMVLSYSRLMYVEFTVSQEMEDFLRGHVNGFAFFGNCCPKVILYDNLRSVVTWRQKRLIQFNHRFQEFAGTYLFEPRPCNPGRGNEKPRAETGVRYVKQNFLAGREFRDLTDLRVQALHWLRDTANMRIHQTTRERPVERFERERAHLQLVSRDAFDTRICRSLNVNHQARVIFQTNSYTVPPRYVGKVLTLKAGPDRIWLYDSDAEVASHIRSYGRYRDHEDAAHAKAILATKTRGQQHKDRDSFLALGRVAERFLEGIVRRGKGNPDFHISKLLWLVREYSTTCVLEAMDRAESFEAYGADVVQNILYQRLGQAKARLNPLDLTTRPELAQHTTDLPDLNEYDHLTQLEDDDDETGLS